MDQDLRILFSSPSPLNEQKRSQWSNTKENLEPSPPLSCQIPTPASKFFVPEFDESVFFSGYVEEESEEGKEGDPHSQKVEEKTIAVEEEVIESLDPTIAVIQGAGGAEKPIETFSDIQILSLDLTTDHTTSSSAHDTPKSVGSLNEVAGTETPDSNVSAPNSDDCSLDFDELDEKSISSSGSERNGNSAGDYDDEMSDFIAQSDESLDFYSESEEENDESLPQNLSDRCDSDVSDIIPLKATPRAKNYRVIMDSSSDDDGEEEEEGGARDSPHADELNGGVIHWERPPKPTMTKKKLVDLGRMASCNECTLEKPESDQGSGNKTEDNHVSTPVRHKGHPSARTPKTISRFTRRKISLTRELFDKYNESVFHESLPTDLPVSWNSRLLTTAGITKMKKSSSHDRTAAIELSTKVVDDEERLRITLLHEMCHAAAWLIDGELKPPHGPAFWRWANRAHARLPLGAPEAAISTCHSYSIHKPHEFACSNTTCGITYHRYSRRGIDVARHRCGKW
jgi:hypothetical protein